MKRTKTSYFLTVMMIYLGIFLAGLFLIMLFFTIFSCKENFTVMQSPKTLCRGYPY